MFDVDKVLANVIPKGDDQCRFDYQILEASIKALVKERLGSEDITMSAATGKPSCRTFVVATLAEYVNSPPELFRSYELPSYPTCECTIWEAARATSAAPTFFKPIKIKPPSPGIDYVDGGLGYNNPSDLARAEAQEIWPSSRLCCLVSLGTGHSKAISLDLPNLETNVEEQRTVLKTIRNFIPYLLDKIPGWETATKFPAGVLAVIKMAGALSNLITDSNAVDNAVANAALRGQLHYFRFNVERQVGDVGLQDHSKSGSIAVWTRGYMAHPDRRAKKMECVRRISAPHSFSGELLL